MQIRNLFRENMLLEVYDQESEIYYKSLLQEVNERNLAIGIPMKEGKTLILEEGTSYLFRVLQESAVYFFYSEVQGKKRNDRVLLYLLAWPNHIERRQRRRFYRLAHTFDVNYWVLADDVTQENFDRKREAGEEGTSGFKIVVPKKWVETWDQETLALYKQVGTNEPCRAVAINLSGGGLLLVTKRSLLPGALLGLHFVLQDRGKNGKVMLAKGRVTRALTFRVGKVRHYRYGVEFCKINERMRDEIVRFIFSMSQRRLR